MESGYNNNLTGVGRGDEEDKGGRRVNNSVWLFFFFFTSSSAAFSSPSPSSTREACIWIAVEPRGEIFTLSVTSAEVCDCVRVCACVSHSSVSSGCSYPGRATERMALILSLLETTWGVFFNATASSLPRVLRAGAAAMET